MTVSTLRPNGTVSNSGVSVTGAASLHAALSDNSGASYAHSIADADSATVDLDNLSLPAGALIQSIRVRINVARDVAGASQIPVAVQSLTKLAQAMPTINWVGATTIEVLSLSEWPNGSPLTDSSIDSARLRIQGKGAVSPDNVRVYEAFLDVTYVAIPTVDVTEPTGSPASNRPRVSWESTLDSDGGAQTHHEIRIFNDAQYGAGGFDPSTSTATAGSGVVTGSAATWTPDDPLPNDDYRAYVRVAQTVDGTQHWSDWATSDDFAVAVTLPADPVLALVPESSMGRMRLDITEGAGGAETTDLFEIHASYDSGTTWTPLRTPEGFGLATPDAGAATLYDHEGANGADVSYRVRAIHDASLFEDPEYVLTDWIEDTEHWGPTSDQWLKHPTTPILNMRVTIYQYPPGRQAARQGRVQSLGRSTVIVTSDKRGPEEGSVAFLLASAEERAALKALLDANTSVPLLLQVGANDERPDRWLIFGDRDGDTPVDKGWVADTIETLTWVEVARP
jgi:hypothetical protein